MWTGPQITLCLSSTNSKFQKVVILPLATSTCPVSGLTRGGIVPTRVALWPGGGTDLVFFSIKAALTRYFMQHPQMADNETYIALHNICDYLSTRYALPSHPEEPWSRPFEYKVRAFAAFCDIILNAFTTGGRCDLDLSPVGGGGTGSQQPSR